MWNVFVAFWVKIGYKLPIYKYFTSWNAWNISHRMLNHSQLQSTFDAFYWCDLIDIAGYIHPWSGRFYSLWDTGYAKIHIPIIASVSEHQPTTWVSFFFDLHILVCAFPAGVWYCVKEINDERVFGKGKIFVCFQGLSLILY